uniref:CHK kinase-like domain-containing protein n=1 Tax=Stomoxys calcitrans TaxID=35570 RepID=A0A1I8NRG7_STOCA
MSDLHSNNKELIEKHNQHDLVTRQECEQILEKILKEENISGELKEYEIVPELSTIGYLGEYFHLHMKYHRGTETELKHLRLFVKTRPYQNPDMSDFIERSGMLKKESTLYQNLLNELKRLTPNIWCAQCYLVKEDLFVMQNIIDLGYEPLKDSSVFLNKPQIGSILKGLASMHACSVGYEQKNNLKIGEKLKDVLYEVTVSPKVVWYTAGIKAVLAVALKHPLYQAEPLQNFIKSRLPAILDTVYEMVNPSNKYHNVFCHRDVWGGNVFFAKDQPYEKGAAFVDFQLCRYSPAAIDVLMTLYINIRPQDRRAMENECHELYYQQFSDELTQMSLKASDFMSYEQFKNSLNDLALFGALYNCIAATILRVPGDYLKDMKLNRPDDFHRYTNVDRTDEVLELVKIDAKFRDYMLECIDDMMELILKDYYYKSK